MAGTKVLLLGNGGREHAWAIALKQSGATLFNWAPKINPGIANLAEEVIKEDFSAKPDLTRLNLDLVIIGPEAPLVAGVTDWLTEQGITVFGPNKGNARLEGSKSYMRELMDKYQIEGNIAFTVCKTEEEIFNALESNFELAVKPDGLTGGKGVRVYGDHFKDRGEVAKYAKKLLNKDGIVVLEELLTGVEFTLQAFVHGSRIVFLPLVKDYKRAFDGDIGPNTGSMGSCSFPDHKLPYLSEEDLETAKSIVTHVVRASSIENGTYSGAIYGQFMLTDVGPEVVEFNVRLGDPEAINTLALLQTPLLDLIADLMDEDADFNSEDVKFNPLATCCVYLVPDGYPDSPQPGGKITYEFEHKENIRYASVEQKNSDLVVTKSRSLAIIGYGNSIKEAYANAYDQISDEPGVLRYRSDIGKEFIDA